MRATIRVLTTCITLLATSVALDGAPAEPDDPVGVVTRPTGHALPGPSSVTRTIACATTLAELGPRPAGSEGEQRARDAVATELQATGLDVAIEGFSYRTFRIEAAELELGGIPAEAVMLGLNPYDGPLAFAGEAVVVTDPAQGSEALAGRIVVTNHPLMQLMIAQFDPAVVISVEPGDLESFEARGNPAVVLEVHGAPTVLHSANVVARVGPRRDRRPEILVTSHLDAYRSSPGANDNGTGLCVMIELARSLASRADELPIPVAFVAFGAEENGTIGSRAYLDAHLAELANVVAVVNLDTLGGSRGPIIGSMPSEPPEGRTVVRNRIPEPLQRGAWEGPAGRWRMIHPAIIQTALTACYPDWLEGVVADSAAELGIEIAHLDLISDHRTFALAGVPAISIQSKEHHIHSPEDTAGVLVPETVGSCARLAAEIVNRLQLRSSER